MDAVPIVPPLFWCTKNTTLHELQTGDRSRATDRIVEESLLNQLDNVILGRGILLLRWRSGGVNHPHDMPPSRFPPSPTFDDSSDQQVALATFLDNLLD